MKPRVRFAPSPTGPLHLGGIRTALFNYLFAKSTRGTFILRIEDTDRSRYHPESEKHIVDSLNWLGIPPDESPTIGGPYGPYRQSQRLDIYKKHIDILLRDKKAYVAFDTSEGLEQLRNKDKSFLYNQSNRKELANSLNPQSIYHKYQNIRSIDDVDVENFVVRLKVNQSRPFEVVDELRGIITVETQTLEDKVLLKRDGWPTYHLADIVDDYLMKITHVVRGEEWLPSLPIHRVIYDAFGWNAPKFLHLPLLLRPDKKGKISKRDAVLNGYPIFALRWEKFAGLKELGYLPHAIINYLTLLGWSPKDLSQRNEIFSVDQLIPDFTVRGLQKNPAVVDFDKLKWTNRQHVSDSSTSEILNQFDSFLTELYQTYPPSDVENIIGLIKNRIEIGADITKEANVFIREPQINLNEAQKVYTEHWGAILDYFQSALDFKENASLFKKNIFKWAKSKNIPLRIMMQTLRITIVGQLSGPDLFDIINFVSRDSLIKRVQHTKSITSKIN
ncbi:MAG: glutamate--tRNA ligase [Flavobacteriaceae bacterium]|nr:glutamate--tRNA ligase [Flavobacteriaceae bacterium]